MNDYIIAVRQTAAFLESCASGIKPLAGFLTGTGLGGSTDSITVQTAIPYGDIPNFPVSTVQSHQGELILGSLAGVSIVAMKGRFHLYEGYSPLEVTFPIRVMQELGVRNLILSNASGGINTTFSKGDIMILSDHVNLTGQNPLVGHNVDVWGERFPDMTSVYDSALSTSALRTAEEKGISIRKGVYAGLTGPSLETPAETRYLQRIGCDAVGFSTVMEAIAGIHAGMKVLGLAAITNVNDPDNPQKASVPDIIRTAEHASHDIDTLVSGVIGSLSDL